MIWAYFTMIIFLFPSKGQEKIFLGSSLWESGVPGEKTHKNVGATCSLQHFAKITTYMFLPVWLSQVSRSLLWRSESACLYRFQGGSLPCDLNSLMFEKSHWFSEKSHWFSVYLDFSYSKYSYESIQDLHMSKLTPEVLKF